MQSESNRWGKRVFGTTILILLSAITPGPEASAQPACCDDPWLLSGQFEYRFGFNYYKSLSGSAEAEIIICGSDAIPEPVYGSASASRFETLSSSYQLQATGDIVGLHCDPCTSLSPSMLMFLIGDFDQNDSSYSTQISSRYDADGGGPCELDPINWLCEGDWSNQLSTRFGLFAAPIAVELTSSCGLDRILFSGECIAGLTDIIYPPFSTWVPLTLVGGDATQEVSPRIAGASNLIVEPYVSSARMGYVATASLSVSFTSQPIGCNNASLPGTIDRNDLWRETMSLELALPQPVDPFSTEISDDLSTCNLGGAGAAEVAVDDLQLSSLAKAVDLSYQMPGSNWKLERQYTSEATTFRSVLVGGPRGHAGEQWAISAVPRILPGPADPSPLPVDAFDLLDGQAVPEGENVPSSLAAVDPPPHRDLAIIGLPIQSTSVFRVHGDGTWKPDGTQQSTITRVSADEDHAITYQGTPVDTYRLSSPGGGVRYFADDTLLDAIPNQSLQVPESSEFDHPVGELPRNRLAFADVAGRLLVEIDPAGNARYYEYAGIDTDLRSPAIFSDAGESNAARLSVIYFHGRPSDPTTPDPVGRAVFDWYAGSDGTVDVPEVLELRLRGAAVEVPDGLGGWTRIQEVEYMYNDGTYNNADLGVAGDLIQVITKTLVDENESNALDPWRYQYTQYRYYNEGSLSTHTIDGQPLNGLDHQLKAIIGPEQIEYFAAEDLNAGRDLHAAAAHLLTLGDNDVVLGGTPLDLAGQICTYDTSTGRLSSRWVASGSCGCGGSGGSQAVASRFDYELFEYEWEDGIVDDTGKTIRVLESVDLDGTGPGGRAPYRATYRDYKYIADGTSSAATAAYLVAEATVADSNTSNSVFDSGDQWARYIVYGEDSTRSDYKAVVEEWDVRGSSAYASVDTQLSQPRVAPTFDTAGIKRTYTYDANARRSGEFVETPAGVSQLSNTTYSSGSRNDLVTSRSEFVGGISLSQSDASYGYHDSDSTIVSRVKFRRPLDPESENGPRPAEALDPDLDSHYAVTWQFYDKLGQLRWTRQPDGVMSYVDYDSTTGAVVLSVENADPSGESGIYPAFSKDDYFVPSADRTPTDVEHYGQIGGWAAPTGGALVTKMTVDALGRITSTTSPAGATSYTRRVMSVNDLESGSPVRYAEITYPHMTDTPEEAFVGPAVKTWMNGGDRPVRQSSFELISGSGYSPLLAAPSLPSTQEVTRAESTYSSAGLMLSERRWWNLDAIAAEGSYLTQYEYDAIGRTRRVIDPEGGVTEYDYDVFDRQIATAIGREGLGSPVVVSETIYDGSPTSLDQGVGNGLVTATVLYPDSQSGNARVTRHYYDDRDRLLAVQNPTAPHSVFVYDNQDRQIGVAQYASLASSIPDPLTDLSGRLSWSRTFYSEQGRAYKTAVAIDPTQAITASGSGSAPANVLESNTWIDEMGRTVASWGPNGPAQKMDYDGHGRVVTSYVTDRGGDALPGEPGSYADAVGIAADHVLQSTIHYYDVVDENPLNGIPEVTGLLLRTDINLRRHDDATIGGMDEPVTTITQYTYDDAGRRLHTLQYGSCSSSGNLAPLSSPGIVPAVNASRADDQARFRQDNAEALVESVIFDGWGRGVERVSPEGTRTVTKLDAMSRRAAIIEAAAALDADDITWSAGDGRWTVNAPSSNGDRVSSFVYDGNSNMTKYVAHTSGSGVQETVYEYGTTNSSGAGWTPSVGSLIASTSLLRTVRYPDASTGVAGAGVAYAVTTHYNQLGEPIWRKDQNETQHEFEYDLAGRVLHDRVTFATTVPGSLVDTTVRRISRTYDAYGRPENVTSLNADPAGSPAPTEIENEVKFEYHPLGMVTVIEQNPVGPVSAASPHRSKVICDYESTAPTAASGGNHVRPVAVVYPSDYDPLTDSVIGDTLTFAYAAGVDDRISRLQAVVAPANGSSPLVQYEHLGHTRPVVIEYPIIQPSGTTEGLRLNRAMSPSGVVDTEDVGYPAFDRYGRVVRQMWTPGGYEESSPGGGVPDRPPYFSHAYTYDKDSLRLTDVDARPGLVFTSTPARPRDWWYNYDRLDRLTRANRGVQATNSHAVGGQEWLLDTVGNWDEFWTDRDASGTFDLAGLPLEYELDDRTHNAANELTQSEFVYPPPASSVFAPYTYDRTGNTLSGLGYTQVYDAWNRLVRVEFASQTISQYAYNGLNWRTHALLDTERGTPDGVLDREVFYYYNDRWQFVEERISTDADTDTVGTSEFRAQQVWGKQYVDDAVVRRVDRDGDGLFAGDDSSGTTRHTFWYLTDPQFNVRMLVAGQRGDETSWAVDEIIDYSPYGVPRHRYPVDLSDNGVVEFSDFTTQLQPRLSGALNTSIGDAAYDVELDFNHDGAIDTNDTDAFLDMYGVLSASSDVPEGWLADSDDLLLGSANSVGYTGHLFLENEGRWIARHRVFAPEQGRWLSLDPMMYVDGRNQYQRARSLPTSYVDPDGRWAVKFIDAVPVHGYAPGIYTYLGDDWSAAQRGDVRAAMHQVSLTAARNANMARQLRLSLTPCERRLVVPHSHSGDLRRRNIPGAMSLDTQLRNLELYLRRMLALQVDQNIGLHLYVDDLGDVEARSRPAGSFIGAAKHTIFSPATITFDNALLDKGEDAVGRVLLHEMTHHVELSFGDPNRDDRGSSWPYEGDFRAAAHISTLYGVDLCSQRRIYDRYTGWLRDAGGRCACDNAGLPPICDRVSGP